MQILFSPQHTVLLVAWLNGAKGYISTLTHSLARSEGRSISNAQGPWFIIFFFLFYVNENQNIYFLTQ